MNTHTPQEMLDYETDLAAAESLIQESVIYSDCEGNMRNWAQDALNNEWRDGISVDRWVECALARMGVIWAALP